MKILHVIIGLDIGGAELALKRLILANRSDNGIEHSVVSLTSVGVVGQQLQAAGIQIVALGLTGLLNAPQVLVKLIRVIRQKRPDIVQCWMYHADLFGGLAARIAGNRHVIWGIRATEIVGENSTATSLVRALCARLSNYVPQTILCVARAAMKSHISLGYNGGRMVVIPNGFDLHDRIVTAEQRSGARRLCNIEEDELLVGFMGRFHVNKGQHNFIQAAALVAQRHPNVRFVMFGRNVCAGNVQLEHWVAATKFADRFELLGEQLDQVPFLAAMDIFCLASSTEGFPNAVGEAMALGIPCAVTDVGDAAFLVSDTGVVVPKEDPVALAAGLIRMLEMSPTERRQLGQNARSRIRDEFSIELCQQRHEALYRDILSTERS